MKTLHLFTLAMVGIGVIATINKGSSNSNGANPANTGAPGESTCASGGCHSDNALNGGPGNLVIKPTFDGDNTTTYDTNTTLTLALELKDQEMNAAGFQITAQRVDNNSPVGNFKPQNNQQKVGFNNNYLTHTQPATSFEGNIQEWTIKWESPDQDVGDIRFYAAGNAANNDGGSGGDYIYSSDTTLSYGELSTSKQARLRKQTKIYPNPAKDFLNIHLPAATKANFQIKLIDMHGKPVKSFSNQVLRQTTKTINLPADLEQGAYTLQLKSQNHQLQETILVQ